MAEDERFLQRWARRKAEARDASAEPTAEAAVADAPGASADEVPTAAVEPPALPDLDSLGPESDYRAFMLPGVPGHLRRAALRKLWLSDPVYANLDGLVDFGEDWTDQARVIPGMKTAYRVGRGLLAEPKDVEPPSEVAADENAAAEPDDDDSGEAADSPADPAPDTTRA